MTRPVTHRPVTHHPVTHCPVTHHVVEERAMNDTPGLQVTTPSEREIVMTRVFDAPRTLVFDAFTRPDLLKRSKPQT